ncbi:MAG: hypothetical protein GYB67_12475 [Chloroflexi bacterium]|nr:hypothetical protein [Chloroflexota bacterium]
MRDLPEFAPTPTEKARAYIAHVLTVRGSQKTQLRDLIAHEDGHFRAIFDPAYFILPPEQTEPSKSQWNTLKKRMKRVNPLVFVFKAHGEVECGPDGRCYYIDFGFFYPDE